MLRSDSHSSEHSIDPQRVYGLPDAALKLGLSVWHARHKAVVEHRISFLRHSPKGKLLFLGRDLLDYLETCRQPAVGERGRRAAQAAVATVK